MIRLNLESLNSPAGDETNFDAINPSTTEVIAQMAHGKAADIQAAVASAREAFENGPWSKTTTPN